MFLAGLLEKHTASMAAQLLLLLLLQCLRHTSWDSQASITGSWNQLKHEPAGEGSCFSLNCPLTVKKSICGGALLPSRQEHWPLEPLTVLRENQFLSQSGFVRLFLPQTTPEAAQRQTGDLWWGCAQCYISACHKLKKTKNQNNQPL